MGAKGDRAAKEPLAMRMYADGASLTDIAEQLDISDTTLRRWKSETIRRWKSESQVPGDDIDGWDKARQQKRGNIQRLGDLFARELKFAEDAEAGSISSAAMDALSKLGALVQRWEAVERARAEAAKPGDPDIDRPKIFLEDMEFVAEVLEEIDPEGLKILARNFDEIVRRFKEQSA